MDANAVNPLEGNKEAIQGGAAIFRARCTGCHGADARGLVGPDLTGLWAGGATDARLFQVVQRGVPGTEMPPYDVRAQDIEIWQTLAYLRTLNSGTANEVATGDPQNGDRIFRANCNGCHLVNGRGGQLGPELSRIGSARPRATLIAKIRGKSDNIRQGYEAVTLVTRDGQKIRGVKKNEDDFSIQIMDTRERLQGYLKASLQQVIQEKGSVMPAYGVDRLSDKDLDDLLSYLRSLRPAQMAGR